MHVWVSEIVYYLTFSRLQLYPDPAAQLLLLEKVRGKNP